MKRYRNLYPAIHAFGNLFDAYRTARRGKRRRPNVAEFEYRQEEELVQLQDQLAARTWRPGPYRHFTLYEGKPRRISAAPFRDRVVHHALCNIIEPIWERRFIHDSYACRKGKGQHAALDRCTRFARSHPYVLRCDIVQFFPSMDHEILSGLLERHIADPDVMMTIGHILDSGKGIHDAAYRMQWYPGDDLLAAARPRGLPIGNQTSQFWANVYLHGLDEFVKRELGCRAYLRYCDDFLLFAGDKPTLHRRRREIETFLAGLRLRIHPHKTAVQPVSAGFPFLGFTVYPDHRRLARHNGVRYRRRWRRMVEDLAAGRIDLDTLESALNGWIGHVRHGDTWGLRRAIISAERIVRA